MRDVKTEELFSVLFCLVLLSSVDSLTWTGQPTNPTEAVEGNNVVLTWNYSLTADEQTNSQSFFLIQWFKFNLSSLVFDQIASKTFISLVNPPLSYGEPLSPHIVIDRNHKTDSVTLHINDVKRDDEGQYKIQYVKDPFGPALGELVLNLTVLDPPKITSISLNQTVAEGDVVLLNCTADGNPKPNITWNRLSRNGVVVRVGPAEKYLNITGKQDEGGYRCIADNGIGNAAFSDVLNITVESYHPINTFFSTNLTNNTVNLNESFTLICNADANPAASYRLYREQESLQEQSNGTYLTFVSTRTKQVTYTCIPFNGFGDGLSKTITVTVYSNQVYAELTMVEEFVSEYRDLNNQVSKQLLDSFVLEMDKVYQNDSNYIRTEVTGLRSGSVIVSFILYFKNSVTPSESLQELEATISNDTFGTYQVGNLTPISPGASTFTSTTPRTAEPTDGPPWVIIGAVAGGVVLVALVVGFVTWWVHKKRKCIKDTKTRSRSHLGTSIGIKRNIGIFITALRNQRRPLGEAKDAP
ncbi:uncharacterized protein [Montipora capricornis]|uniref:uncharacterized protein isoform X2 n=1 Tax=Montipora capricornis TaxID=246305 RepID=UPI0035F166B4